MVSQRKKWDKTYEEKRKEELYRVPTIHLTLEQNNMLLALADIYGSKKEAVIEGLVLLMESTNDKNKSKESPSIKTP